MKISTIIIIEDNHELRELFSIILQDAQNLIFLKSFSNAESAIEEIENLKPDIVLMDVDLPGIDGIECTKRVKKLLPNIEVIMITVFENSKTVFDALCAGATGYLSKNTNPEQLITAISEVQIGGAPMSSHIAKMVVKSFHINQNSPLSNRESEILSLLSSGKSYIDIANTLTISKDTVKFHIKNIYIKLQVNSKSEAINIASKERYI